MTIKMSVSLIILLAWLAAISSCALLRIEKFKNSLGRSTMASRSLPVSFKFILDDWMFIKARLNNQENDQEFMLDTGSPCTYCFRTKKTAGLKSRKLARFGGIKFDYGASAAEIATVKYNDLAYLVSDQACCWDRRSSGFIGVNAMQNSIWEFNFQDTTITISDTLSDFKHIAGAYKVKFEPLGKQQTPLVKIAINDTDTITALIDTGNDKFLELSSKFNAQNIRKACSDCIQTTYYNINEMGEHVKRDSIIETNHIKAGSVKIGNLDIRSAILDQNLAYKGKNLIGLGFLKNFIVTVDWKQYYIYLKPIENKDPVVKRSTYGFKCDKTDNIVKVTKILRNGPAEKEGMKCGDQLVKINNRNAWEIDQSIIDVINNDLPSEQEISVQFRTKGIRLQKISLFK